MLIGDKLELNIEKLSFGGAGIARAEKLVVFVSDSAPGDHLIATVTKVKKRYLEAKATEILSPGPSRRAAPCPIATDCGGCQWQHIEYSEQLAQKKLILSEQFAKSSLLRNVPIPDILSCDEFRYRNRIQVRSNGKQTGFFKKATNSIVPTTDCLITEEEITREFSTVAKLGSANKLSKVEIYRNESGEVKTIRDKSHGSQDGFSQVNEAVNFKMLEWVLEKVNEISPSTFYDLYAGNGNFSRYLESNAYEGKSEAIEWSKSAISLGKKLCSSNSRISWHEGKVETLLSSLMPPSDSLVLIDPPRIGCDARLIDSLAQIKSKYLIYISCNPTTFQRDVELLATNREIEIKNIQALDMFPQTYHIELMALIELA